MWSIKPQGGGSKMQILQHAAAEAAPEALVAPALVPAQRVIRLSGPADQRTRLSLQTSSASR